MYDVLIIGAGVTGSFIARELSKYDLNIVVLDKENDVGNVTSMANSAIVHVPYSDKPGSLKARFCKRGNELYDGICKDLDVSFKRCGSFVLAVTDEQVINLRNILENAKINGVNAYEISFEEAKKMESELSDEIKMVINIPDTAVIYPFELTVALMENAMDNGCFLHLNTEVTNIEKIDNIFKVKTNKGIYESKIVINCAGLYADEINNMVATYKLFNIKPTRGEYILLAKNANYISSRVLYPTPTSKGKGVIIIPTTHGNMMVGPNAEYVDDKEAINTTIEGINFIKENAAHIIKDIPYQHTIRTFAGLRAKGNTGDFVIEESDVPNFINVACIESPGLASSPAIAEYVVNELIKPKIDLIEKTDYNPKRRPLIKMMALDIEERNKLVKEDSKFGKLICRCEKITEGEIVDCIRRNCGATTIKGVKKRVRAGMGKCQGGFCEPVIIEILARELHIDPKEVLLDDLDSNILIEETKVN